MDFLAIGIIAINSLDIALLFFFGMHSDPMG